jgi:hypothetical protein
LIAQNYAKRKRGNLRTMNPPLLAGPGSWKVRSHRFVTLVRMVPRANHPIVRGGEVSPITLRETPISVSPRRCLS